MIKKPKTAIFSDLHLGIYGNSQEWHKIALNWADWIVGELTKKKITDILFLGDFFHNRSEISVQTVHVASELIKKFSKFNMFMIVGNHDAYYKNRADIHSLGLLKGHDNITIIDENLEMEVFGKNIILVPWNSDIPDKKYDYIFGHFEIQSFKMNNYKVCDHGLQPMDFLGWKTDKVFSGHFHLRSTKKYNEGTIHYVGSTFGQDFNDVGNVVGYHVLDFEDDSLEFFENTVSPKFERVYLSQIKSVTEEDVKGNIVKFIIDKELEDDKIDKLKIYLSKFQPFQLTTEYNVNTKTIGEVESVDSVDTMEMINEFVDQLKLEEDQQQRVTKITKELYEKNKE
jgi:DNA repair exonuclease SbcCD nuclease subunit